MRTADNWCHIRVPECVPRKGSAVEDSSELGGVKKFINFQA